MKILNYAQNLIKLILIGSLLGVGLSPIAVSANTYQETLIAKMENLKQTEDNWIQINLTTQRLIAWEGERQVYAIVVSTGKKSTPTRPGIFAIREKRRLDRMRGPGYDVPNVPFAMYYHGGYAIHGAYWHNRFGTPVSHGCTNVAVNHAEWLFNWASVGTPIVIHY
jgi:lipoprotein-anchoring transpeptidase ErfK/SrfK